MDLAKVLEIAEQANEFIDNMRKKANKIINKINKCLDDLENLISNAITHSVQYINEKTKIITDKIDNILKEFERVVKRFKDEIKAWYDYQINYVKFNIVKVQQSKLGIDIPDDQIKLLANAVPHPELPIPDFKIAVPDISSIANSAISSIDNSIPSISRIPNI